MSIVAYRDGVIACDGRMTSGSGIISDNVRKIAKGPKVIGGFCGGAEELGPYLKWIEDGAVFNKLPKGEGTGFVVFDRRVKKNSREIELVMVNKMNYMRLPLTSWDYYADGSGFKAAFGALYMGGSAEDAVNAAIRHDNDCGGVIQVEELF